MKAEWTNRDSLSIEETTGQNSKSILVINTPSRCFNCPVHETLDAEEGEHEFMVFCNAEHWREPSTNTPVKNLEERPDWCPLRPLPQKKEIRNSIQYRDLAEEYRKEGWNECIDEITGETE